MPRINNRVEEDLMDQLINSNERRLARLLLILAYVADENSPQPIDFVRRGELLPAKSRRGAACGSALRGGPVRNGHSRTRSVGGPSSARDVTRSSFTQRVCYDQAGPYRRRFREQWGQGEVISDQRPSQVKSETTDREV
jgi:hypothetical protein